jgi:hypothetical protein
MVLALVKRERKVSFGEAWRAHQSKWVRTYAVWCIKLMKGRRWGGAARRIGSSGWWGTHLRQIEAEGLTGRWFSIEAGGRPVGNSGEEGHPVVLGDGWRFVEVWYTWLVLGEGSACPEDNRRELVPVRARWQMKRRWDLVLFMVGGMLCSQKAAQVDGDNAHGRLCLQRVSAHRQWRGGAEAQRSEELSRGESREWGERARRWKWKRILHCVHARWDMHQPTWGR